MVSGGREGINTAIPTKQGRNETPETAVTAAQQEIPAMAVSEIGATDNPASVLVEVKPRCAPAYGVSFRLPPDWTYAVMQTDDDPTSNVTVNIKPNSGCAIVNSAENWSENYEEATDQILSAVEFIYYGDAIDALVNSFEKNGFDVEIEAAEPQILRGTRYVLTFSGVSNGRIMIYKYNDAIQAQNDAMCIDDDGFTIYMPDQTHYVTWKDIPHFYCHNELIVQYVGTDDTILNLLTEMFGNQFAGG